MAVIFNGAGEFMFRDTNLPAMDSFTMMGWFKLAAVTGSMMAFGQASGGYLSTYTTGSGILKLWNGLSASSNGTTLSTGTWYHLTMAADRNDLMLYLNGVLDITHGLGMDITSEILYYASDPDLVSSAYVSVEGVKIFNETFTEHMIRTEVYRLSPFRREQTPEVVCNTFSPLLYNTGLTNLVLSGDPWQSEANSGSGPGPGVPYSSFSPRRIRSTVPYSSGYMMAPVFRL
jgi:concanavalin A-like lectin/glucanase superfamily protein